MKPSNNEKKKIRYNSAIIKKKEIKLPSIQFFIYPERNLSLQRIKNNQENSKSNQTEEYQQKRMLQSPSIKEIGLEKFHGENKAQITSIVFKKKYNFLCHNGQRFKKLKKEDIVIEKMNLLRNYEKPNNLCQYVMI